MFRRLTLLLAVVAFAFASTATHAADPGVNCATSKHKAATKKLSDKMKCHDKALKKGVAVDPECLTKAEAKFNASFTKAESKGGCLTTGDAASIEAVVDNTLTSLLDALPGTLPPTCDIVLQDCEGGDGCYATGDTCASGTTGVCATAGAGTQGASCSSDADCAVGYGCFLAGLIQQCLHFCDEPGDCGVFEACTLASGCTSLAACVPVF